MAPRNTRVNPEVGVRSPARSFAAVLDNYYAPARDRRSERATQQGFDAFSSIFAEQAARAKNERREGEKAQGVADAMREQAGEEMKGVQTGSLFRQNSSFYMAGLNETRGRAAAQKFKQETALAYQQWSGRHADDDGSGFREFMNERVGAFLETLGDDKHKLAGALPIINETTRNIATSHTAFTNERLHQETLDNFGTDVAGLFDSHLAGDMEMDELIATLQEEADSIYNMEGGDANDALVNAAIMWADSRNSVASLEALVQGADAGKIKLNLRHQQMIGDAVDMVETQIERENSRLETEEVEERKQVIEGLQNDLWDALAEDPNLDVRKWMKEQDVPAEYRENIYRNLLVTQRAVQSARTDDGPTAGETMFAFQTELRLASTPSEKREVLAKYSSLLTPSEVKTQMDAIFDQARGIGPLNDDTIKDKRDSWLEMVQVVEDGSVTVGQTGEVRTVAEYLYNERMQQLSKEADPQDYDQLHERVVEEVQDKLVRRFPDYRQNATEDTPTAGVASGAAQASEDLAAEQRSRMETMKRIQDADTAMAVPIPEPTPYDSEAAPVETETVPQSRREEARGVTPEVRPVEPPEEPEVGRRAGARSTTGDTPEVTPEEKARQEEIKKSVEDQIQSAIENDDEEGFHVGLIRRFTDGEDTRSASTLATATTVLENNPDLREGVARLGQKYGIPPMALMAIMDFETRGTFDPAIRNAAGSGATGLIQFLPKTARALGTTTEELARMSQTEQLVYVEKYFDQFAGKLKNGNVDDLYMAVLWPAAVGKPAGYPLFRRGTTAYRQNAGLDHNGDGTITKYEAASKVRRTFYGY